MEGGAQSGLDCVQINEPALFLLFDWDWEWEWFAHWRKILSPSRISQDIEESKSKHTPIGIEIDRGKTVGLIFKSSTKRKTQTGGN